MQEYLVRMAVLAGGLRRLSSEEREPGLEPARSGSERGTGSHMCPASLTLQQSSERSRAGRCEAGCWALAFSCSHFTCKQVRGLRFPLTVHRALGLNSPGTGRAVVTCIDAMITGPFSKKCPSSACLLVMIQLAVAQRDRRSSVLVVMIE